jgi:alpha-L-fucosidase
LGQRIQGFSVSGYIDGEWKELIKGTTIGNKVIRKLPVINTSKIKVNINKSKACPVISNIELYSAPGE